MSKNLQSSKSILAKLLATENITVSHQNVKTAYFDLKNRTMTLPVWKDMDGDLYDLLTGHEVGHALNTPQEGWHNAVKDSDNKKFKDFLNVIEDARIEKLVKRKFPGLSRSFANAYASLYDRDFFGIKNLKSTDKLNLIDRINLRFKMGAHVVVSFNDEERALVREIENAETWDQVYDIAQRVYGYVKEKEQDKVQNQQQLRNQMQQDQQEEQQESGEDFSDDSDDSEDSDFGDSDESDLSEESDDSDSENSESSPSEEDEDADSEASANGFSDGGDGDDEDEDEPQSVTDRNFRRREQELVNETGKVYMINLPDANLDNIILPNSVVMNDLERYIRMQVIDPSKPYGRYGISYETVVQKCVRKFNTNNKKIIMHILKEFEMRKKASEYARAQTARTGELNMNVLHKYRFSNDLFKKITVVPKGKNHGFIMFMDMSGSMCDVMRNTIEQTLILASFCKLAKVPFEIYGFSDDMYNNKKLIEMRHTHKFEFDPDNEMKVTNDLHLKHLIGSSLSPLQYRRSFNLLCVVANEYNRYHDSYGSKDNDHGYFGDWTESGFGLNGTPFIPTLLASREIITRFQNKHQLDVCNVIYLTDGSGGSDLSYPTNLNSNYQTYKELNRSVIYFVDKKTKKKVKVDGEYNWQAGITKLVSEVTGCKHIGFYIGVEHSIKRDMKWTLDGKSPVDVINAKKSMRENRFYQTDSFGYDKYFYVAIPKTNIQDENLAITSDMTKHKMAREFSKNVNSKRNNRLLLTKLAEELAVA